MLGPNDYPHTLSLFESKSWSTVFDCVIKLTVNVLFKNRFQEFQLLIQRGYLNILTRHTIVMKKYMLSKHCKNIMQNMLFHF